MKEMMRYGFILALICVIASGLLAGMNALTKNKIISQAQAEEEASLKEVMPEASEFVPVKSDADILYYQAKAKDGKLLGIVFKASGKGYSSTIETMVGMFNDGTIAAIKVLSQNETPGLGTQVAESEFTEQFKKQDALQLSDVQAITGASISSQAVMDSVKVKAKEIQGMLKNAE